MRTVWKGWSCHRTPRKETKRPQEERPGVEKVATRHDSATAQNIIGMQKPTGEYIVNPGPETVIEENSNLIILGNQKQLKDLSNYLALLKNQ